MSQHTSHRVAKDWSFSFNISPSNEHPGLVSFRMDWLGLLAVQGTLKSLLQHHSSKTSILQHSAFFIVQLSHPYMTTGKTIALTRRTFVGNSSAFGCNVLKISMRSISSNVSFKTCVSFLIFYFDDLSIGVSGELKYKDLITMVNLILIIF